MNKQGFAVIALSLQGCSPFVFKLPSNPIPNCQLEVQDTRAKPGTLRTVYTLPTMFGTADGYFKMLPSPAEWTRQQLCRVPKYFSEPKTLELTQLKCHMDGTFSEATGFLELTLKGEEKVTHRVDLTIEGAGVGIGDFCDQAFYKLTEQLVL